MKDTEDKQAWCDHGALEEQKFVNSYGDNLGVVINPGKYLDEKEGKYLPDLFSYRYSRVADLKRVTTPFFTAARYGYNPNTTVTMNMKDVYRYGAKYPKILLYFWVSWDEQTNYGVDVDAINGIWAAPFRLLFSLDLEIHGYQKRQTDTNGNAKCSMLIDLNKLARVL